MSNINIAVVLFQENIFADLISATKLGTDMLMVE